MVERTFQRHARNRSVTCAEPAGTLGKLTGDCSTPDRAQGGEILAFAAFNTPPPATECDPDPRPEVTADDLQARQAKEEEENRSECLYIYEQISNFIPFANFSCIMRNEYPHNIVITNHRDTGLRFVILRRRNGAYVSGISGVGQINGEYIDSQALKIFRGHDKEGAIEHVREFLQATAGGSRKPKQPDISRKRHIILTSASILSMILIVYFALHIELY